MDNKADMYLLYRYNVYVIKQKEQIRLINEWIK